MPGRRTSFLADFTITIDSRERYPYKFTKQQAATERTKLPIGDYGIVHEEAIVALVERESLADLSKGFTDGGLAYQMADLATHPRSAVVVEERYSQIFKNEYVQGGWLADVIAQIQVRYPTVPIVFCETRPLAEEWTFRFLGAALAHHLDEPDEPDDPTAPREWRE